MLARMATGVAAFAMFASACGSGSSTMTDAAVCPTPSPTATAGTGAGQRFRPNRYVSTIQAGVAQLTTLYETQRAKWPDRTFSRDASFRVDFATYADTSICAAQSLLALDAPANQQETKDSFDFAVRAYLSHVQAGRDAVRTRNVSEFRTWFDGVQQKLQAVRDVANTASGRP